MALGYEGYVTLKVDAIQDVALGNSGGVPKSRVRMDSAAAYGGEISTPVSDMGIGAPHNYDWIQWDGNLDYDVHEDFLTNQIIAWLFDRQKGAEVFFQTREGNVQQFNDCFWSSLSLNAGDGSALTGSCGFVGMTRDSYTRGGDYIANKEGNTDRCDEPPSEPYFPPMFEPTKTPIPYWNTQVDINSTMYEFISWSLNCSQDVVKFFGCEANSTAQEPKYVAVGPLSIVFSGEYMFVDTATFASPDTLSSLKITMAGDDITLQDLELVSDTDSLQTGDGLVPIAVEYFAYTLVA